MLPFKEDLINHYEMNGMDLPIYLDLYTGHFQLDNEALSGVPGIEWDDEESDERYLALPKQDSREEFQWMEEFALQISDENKQKALENVLNRRKPFRNFKDAVFEQGVREEWFEFRRKMIEKEMVSWLEFNNISVSRMEELRRKHSQ